VGADVEQCDFVLLEAEQEDNAVAIGEGDRMFSL
jgi:hypothetical protein